MVDITRKKYIIPREKAFSHLYYLLRKQANLRPEQSFFLLLNNFTPSLMSPIDDLYKVRPLEPPLTSSEGPGPEICFMFQNHADADEFLYICYFEENTFGHELYKRVADTASIQ